MRELQCRGNRMIEQDLKNQAQEMPSAGSMQRVHVGYESRCLAFVELYTLVAGQGTGGTEPSSSKQVCTAARKCSGRVPLEALHRSWGHRV